MNTPALHFDQVSKTYRNPKGDFQALKHVSLTVEQGEFFGLLGPNGAGKTTLISILAGLTQSDASTNGVQGGSVKLLGHDVVSSYAQARRMLGLVPQELVFDPFFTVQEVLDNQAGYFGYSAASRAQKAWHAEVLEGLGLADKAKLNMRQLSGGMKRRVLVAQALVHKPPVIVLDEPTAGVDVELRQTLWGFISKLNKAGHTILLTTHYLEEAEALCNRVAMLQRGQVVALAQTDELLKSASANVLRFKLSAGELPAALAATARVTGRVVQIPAPDAAAIESALATARAAGCVVEQVEIRPADLEDVFLDIMKKKDLAQPSAAQVSTVSAATAAPAGGAA